MAVTFKLVNDKQAYCDHNFVLPSFCVITIIIIDPTKEFTLAHFQSGQNKLHAQQSKTNLTSLIMLYISTPC